MPFLRLDKLICNMFSLSRSEARMLIKRGKVTVGGAVVKVADTKVDSDNDTVMLDGKTALYKEYVYLVMNKPKGVLSASSDKNAKTVIDLVPERFKRRDLFPVGRLDKDTTGLLIITDDGEFCHEMLSPNKKVYKKYGVLLDGIPTEDTVNEFKKGIVLSDGSVCRPAKLRIFGDNYAEVEIFEGKYHQVKRMFGVFGLGVVELKRLSFGGLELPDGLNEGDVRELTDSEIKTLKS